MIAAQEFQQRNPGQRTLSDYKPLEVVDPNEQVTMSVLVRRSAQSLRLSSSEKAEELAVDHRRYLSRKEVARMFGRDLEYVAQSSRRHGLTVVAASPARRMIVLKGTIQQMRGFASVEYVGNPM